MKERLIIKLLPQRNSGQIFNMIAKSSVYLKYNRMDYKENIFKKNLDPTLSRLVLFTC